MPSKWKEAQLKCHAFGTQKNPCPCLYKGKKIKNRKEQFKENTVFFSLHPTLRLCIFFFCQAERVEEKMIRIMERYTLREQEILCP